MALSKNESKRKKQLANLEKGKFKRAKLLILRDDHPSQEQ